MALVGSVSKIINKKKPNRNLKQSDLDLNKEFTEYGCSKPVMQ